MKILLTGANGFLGSHLVTAFLNRGHQVRALIRPAANISSLNWPVVPTLSPTPSSPEVEIFRADLRAATPASLAPTFQNIDALVHLAAAVTGPEEDQFVATVIGTERLLAAMAQSQTKRLILASSFSVYNWSKIHGTLSESSPLEDTENLSASSQISNLKSQIPNSPDPSVPQSLDPPTPHLYLRDGYAIAKIWQEKLTRQLAQKNNWQLTILRPGFIWGKSDTPASDNAYLACLGQNLGPFHLTIAPFAKLPLTHVENCADAFATATLAPFPAGGGAEPNIQTYNILDPTPPRTHTYYHTYRRAHSLSTQHSALSTRPRLSIPTPYFLFYTLTRLAQFTSKTLFRNHGGGKLPSLLTPTKFQARFKPLHFTTAFPKSYNWTPPLNYQQSLAKTYKT